ncbi:MAG: L-aspartate oxidase [Planctomycetia bacterium]|nr:L-aspartate oxidase [Planctomycetia bacterium]
MKEVNFKNSDDDNLNSEMKVSCGRFLTSFNVKDLPHMFTDILIIGAGLAGLRAALAIHPQLQVLMITKTPELTTSNSDRAQGGIASVLSPEDNFEGHIKDTLTAGGDLCDSKVVERVIHEGPRRIEELVKWGANFDLNADGAIQLGREGGHQMNRVAHAHGDATGHELVRTLVEKVHEAENIKVWTGAYTVDLLTTEDGCVGALVKSTKYGRIAIWARQTILASGGVGQIYRETTNAVTATGDGMAIALRAGAVLRDMEFMQFHPTVLYVAGSARHLITEAIRGEGAYLIDKNGYRFMYDYDSRGELAPRDVVSRAICRQMIKTDSGNVFLTLKHKNAEMIKARFPGIYSTCQTFGIDITKDPIPVRPGAHYMMGGVQVDECGRTNIKNLYAVGEVSSSGLHGANRLASNSLLEALVYGAAAGETASVAAQEMSNHFQVIPLEYSTQKVAGDVLHLEDIQNALKSLMWRYAAVNRERKRLEEALSTLNKWHTYVLSGSFKSPVGWELQNMLIVATMLVRAALAREETRGCHNRSDFPEMDPQGNYHITFVREESS